MAVTPDMLTLFDAARLVQRRTRVDTSEGLGYLAGDVWQEGACWIGPRLAAGDGSQELLAEIRRVLGAANLARELVERHVAGVVGREPAWSIPGAPDADLEALTAWWDRRGVVLLIQGALAQALAGEAPVLRLLVPTPPAVRPATLEAALEAVALEVLPSTTATVLDDAAAGLHLACAVYDASARTLGGLLGRESARRTAEIVYRDAVGRTVIRAETDAGPDPEAPATDPLPEAPATDPLPLGGRLTMHAIDDVPPLLTPTVRSLQRHLTRAITVMGRNMDVAGFVERIFIDLMRPGRRVPDASAPGGERFEPVPYQAGPGAANFLMSRSDQAGNPAGGSAVFRDPASPETFAQTIEVIVYQAHKEARQLHALIAGDAAPSGESRRQAAADFEASLGPSARAVESAVRWLVETAYALALALRGGAVPDGLRATATCTLSAGLTTIEEAAEIREGVGAGLLSRARYQTALGADDPDAEDAAIAEDDQDEGQELPEGQGQGRPADGEVTE